LAAGERLAKGGMGNQQHERSDTQDDMHFPQILKTLRSGFGIYTCKNILVQERDCHINLAGLPISILCAVHVMSLLLDCAMTGLNKCDTRSTNSSTTIITSFSNFGWFPNWSTKLLFVYI
jgi:hypothetical protein